jgi:3-isopropylmalate/(R)-2-methylmalate dehydratase large subunit
MGMTMAEKILARASGRDRVTPGEMVIANIDRLLVLGEDWQEVSPFFDELGIKRVWNPDRVVVIHDHMVPPGNVPTADAYFESRQIVEKFGIRHFYDVGRSGICHQLFAEKGYALPGQLVVGTDSHTTTYGALNTASRGIVLDLLYVLVKGRLWFRIPETIRFEVNGKMPNGVMSKDLFLFIAGKYGTDLAIYKSVEFVGPTVEEMSISSRMTISNMGVEIGAKFLIFEVDDKTQNYLKDKAQESYEPVRSDPDAIFQETFKLRVDSLEPQVACPHDVGNVRPVRDVKGIPFDQAFLGSCTNGRYEDLEIAAKILKGRKIHPRTRMIVTPASAAIYREALQNGLIDIFINAEAVVTNPTCGACAGIHLGVLGTGERCIASQNRNFKGRMGSPSSELFLASPATVAASAIAGVIADPRDYLQ